jgi:NADPH:quinone reductase-like Zn-dependent oxidoreductase
VWNKDGVKGCAYVDAGFAIPIPKHVDAAEASTLLHMSTPAFQSIRAGIVHANFNTGSYGRYTAGQLEGRSVLIQNGNTEMGLALIELALGLGAEHVYATASCVYHSMLEGAGATPLGLVERKEDKAWESWKALQENRSIGLVVMQEKPSLMMLDMFMTVLDPKGSIVLMGELESEDQLEENEENTPPIGNNKNAEGSRDMFEVVEKARIAHEKTTLEHRLVSCSQLVTYDGVMANIINDPLAWKEDVSFLVSLLAQGALKPRVNQRVYSSKDVPMIQDRIKVHGQKKSIVCLPSEKFSSITTRTSSHAEDCSLRTRIEAQAVTKIAAVWRMFACQQAYKCTIDGKLL